MMNRHWATRLRVLTTIPLACATPVAAQEKPARIASKNGVDDIIVTAARPETDATHMAADAAVLLHVAGMVGDPI